MIILCHEGCYLLLCSELGESIVDERGVWPGDAREGGREGAQDGGQRRGLARRRQLQDDPAQGLRQRGEVTLRGGRHDAFFHVT